MTENKKYPFSLGIDIGSTTAKIVLTENGKVLFEKYERHLSRVRAKTLELLREIEPIIGDNEFTVALSGSAGLGLAESAGIPFVQEVFATGELVKELCPDTSTIIELGGEDAKIIFFDGGTDERMNGTCAGGTGAFIDQMATLLDLTVDEMDRLSLDAKRIYPIASRCGVFAKTDIQPLLNQGARKEDVAASIYQAVVNQTIAGLAQGRKIKPKVLFLGGPLYFCPEQV
ncbi:MAG: 2-hydroxyglutaryl-CoA dehydratase, partial [Ruminococcaceae bacterium]|nr:2-hydroxyglutaryl-CoA dehydratase [Oscillospiraceae bacterium]